MALSKLFLLSDKRVDNLLVIGFNPSHTNVNNDVNAPLKILATLIRCLDNELAGSQGRGESEDEEEEGEGREEGLEVNLEKFKEEDRPEEEEARVGGLADRENQQGSTCYMSAMLEFYDDGEECDDKTEEDLLFLNDTATRFSLAVTHHLCRNT
jgi:importin-9